MRRIFPALVLLLLSPLLPAQLLPVLQRRRRQQQQLLRLALQCQSTLVLMHRRLPLRLRLRLRLQLHLQLPPLLLQLSWHKPALRHPVELLLPPPQPLPPLLRLLLLPGHQLGRCVFRQGPWRKVYSVGTCKQSLVTQTAHLGHLLFPNKPAIRQHGVLPHCRKRRCHRRLAPTRTLSVSWRVTLTVCGLWLGLAIW
ncbi:hypothetical protein FBU59_006869 [Linderina macrospora]|uniref:Uncharacterized protein n=1 Tax=Linderina macrospora TaxID=4868 RepID=A0ACC1IYM4_9FUNG|nr:hypothetical protein FBU59_006869 [Linderina macrospora]